MPRYHDRQQYNSLTAPAHQRFVLSTGQAYLQSGIIIANNRTHGNNCLNGGGEAGADIFIVTSTDVTITGNQLSSNGECI